MNTLYTRARAMRKQMTEAEVHLWQALRNRNLGCKFRRQVPLGRYIVDFVCWKCRLIVEVDGGQHFDNPYDIERDEWLSARGFRVLRFWNNEVISNREGVLELIQRASCAEQVRLPLP